MHGKFSFGKKERLKSRKLIEQLFAEGKNFTIFPIKVVYLVIGKEIENVLQAGVSVSSKHFRKATERNRIKRLLRETYRTEKLPLYEYAQQHNLQLILFLIYTDKQMPEYTFIKMKMPVVIKRLIKELNEEIA